MKYTSYIIIIFLSILWSCNNVSNNDSGNFKKSFKEKSETQFCVHLDSITNIYSNFCYHVAFDAPNNWATDAGVSEHTIFRVGNIDSSITFSINVIEINVDDNSFKQVDIWENYSKNQDKLDKPFIALIEKQMKTKVENFIVNKSYIKGNVAIKRSFNYKIKDLDYEYSMTNISYQTFNKNLTFTFGLHLPTAFFNSNTIYYEGLFRQIYFLKDTETLDKLIKESNN